MYEKFIYLMTNSADPDQKPTDLDLHCLQRHDISGFSRTRVNRRRQLNNIIILCIHVYSPGQGQITDVEQYFDCNKGFCHFNHIFNVSNISFNTFKLY